MQNLKTLLEKFKNLGFFEHKIKDSLIRILKEEFDYEIGRKEIVLRDRKIRIIKTGPLKTSIVLRKTKILEKLNEEIKDLNIKILDLS